MKTQTIEKKLFQKFINKVSFSTLFDKDVEKLKARLGKGFILFLYSNYIFIQRYTHIGTFQGEVPRRNVENVENVEK